MFYFWAMLDDPQDLFPLLYPRITPGGAGRPRD